MWTDEFDDDAITEGNVLDIKAADSSKENCEIVKVHCFVCAETYVGPKDGAGLFLFGHKQFHLWEIDLNEVMGGL